MNNIMNLNIFPLTDAAKFEDLCLALWRRILSDPHAQFVGRKGQAQQGVDIIGRKDGTLNWVGVQCKVRSGGELSEADVLDDAEKAKQFNPRLSELFFATTAPRDTKIKAVARELTVKNVKAGGFPVTIYSWDDIQNELGNLHSAHPLHIFPEFPPPG